MITKKVTYEDYNKLSGESVLTLEQALDLFDVLTWHKGTFYHFEINSKHMFQIMWDKSEQFLAEITNDDMIFLQKFTTASELRTLIEHFFYSEDVQNLVGFYKVPVITKSLKEVMNSELSFKNQENHFN